MAFNKSGARYTEWVGDGDDDSKKADWSNCALNREQFGRFLASYLIGERDGFVLNLNGAWGSGKTEFLKRMYVEFLKRDHPVIYIDAWESDFSDTPLTVVASELVSQVESFEFSVDMSEAKKLLGKALKGTVIGAVGLFSHLALGNAAIGTNVANQILSDGDADVMEKIKDGHNAQVQAVKDIRVKLADFAKKIGEITDAELPVIVLVDELDRCRPNYAIEMLEVIKHFFTTRGFVFVVASDTDQLCSSIRTVYGNEFDSARYLKRFFTRTCSLPTPDLAMYLKRDGISEALREFSDITYYPTLKYESDFVVDSITILEALAISYRLELRDVDQLFAKYIACLRAIKDINDTKEQQIVSLVILILGLIEHDKGLDVFYTRTDKIAKHYSEITYPNPEICSNVKIFDLVEWSLKSIIKSSSSDGKTTVGPGLSGTSLLKGNPAQIRDRIANAVSDHGGKSAYWLWGKYKNLIELACHLD